ncbi:MAG: OmpA family protein [Saprospiraceae bacterium]|nr:OmpA family protein [Saprospiraceae bacterium]
MIQNLRTTVSGALTGFSDTDLTVEEKNGRLYVSLSQELLFRSGSDNVESKGRQALKQLADVLKKNPEIDITVEGHTDDVGNAASNWDLSVMRATSVVKVLTTYGIEPERVTASGRGLYAPIASNATATGKAQNRRTEIILSPKLDQLYQLLDR